MPPEIALSLYRGKTFEFGFLYAETEQLYHQITAMVNKAPVQLTVIGHGIPDGWPVRVECVKCPTELNTEANCYEIAKVVDVDTIELNNLNAQCWKDFVGPGVMVLSKPMDLTGWDCRAQVRDKIGGTVLFSWHSDPIEDPDGEIIVDVAHSTFVLTMDALTSAALEWRQGVYDVEAISPSGEVFALTAVSPITVIDEVTA